MPQRTLSSQTHYDRNVEHMGLDFSGRVVVITGGASGIGASLARDLAHNGGTAVVADIDEGAGSVLVAEADGQKGAVEFVRLDVTDRAAVHAVFSDVVERHGRLDGLVCAAVVQPVVAVADLDESSLGRVLDVNVNGTVWACQAAMAPMVSQGSGSIVLFVSGTADLGKPKSSAYTASKRAVSGFAKSFARELANTGVRVNTFRPGVINTPMFRSSNPGADTSTLDRPEDTTGPLMFLLSDLATMTGSILTREMPYRADLELPRV